MVHAKISMIENVRIPAPRRSRLFRILSKIFGHHMARHAVASQVSLLANVGMPAIQAEQKFLHIIGTLALSGNYPGAPGDTLDLTLMVLPPGWVLPIQGTVIAAWAQSIKPTGVSGFSYTIFTPPGNSIRNSIVAVQQGAGASAPNADIPTSAYPAGVSGDTILFEILIGLGG